MKVSLEYLAGFFDGEGCIDCQVMYANPPYEKNFYVRPRLRLSQGANGYALLEHIRDNFGGHLSKERKPKGNQNASKSWEILNKKGIVEMLELLEPLLIVKKQQALLCLWWFNNCAGKNGVGEPVRRAFHDELKLMKRDPQRLSEEAAQHLAALMR